MAASTEPKPLGLRQSMSNLHTWVGLLVGWLLYAMFLTGTVAYFRDEMSQWMRPELQMQTAVPDAGEVADRIVSTLQTLAPGSPQWSFSLPDERNNVSQSFWRISAMPGRRGFDSATFDPRTGQRVEGRETTGGDFFYRFHFNFHYMPVIWGRWLAGFCAMFMLVAIVSGVITHQKIFTDFFTFRWDKGQRSWLDAHNALSVLGLPFHFMITYTGLITLMLLYVPWGNDAAFRTPAERQALNAELSAFLPPLKPSGDKAGLAAVSGMVRQAEERWGRGGVGRVIVTGNGNAAARVVAVRGEAGRVSHSPQYMLFEGRSGRLLQTKDRVGPAAETRGVLYALHLGRFADGTVRWLYFLVSLAGTAMVGTGLVLWTVKRRAKLPDPNRPHIGFHVVERLNIAAIAGLPIAMTMFLYGNRLLPIGMADRSEWEIHLFFITWALTLAHAILRPARRAWLEQFWLAAALLWALPVVSAAVTNRGLAQSLASGDWVFAGFDLALLAFGVGHAALAIRTACRQQQRKPARRSVSAPEPA